MSTTTTSTTDQLRNGLRQTSGIDDLDWATPPAPLHGGFWVEMYTVELADPPPALAGRLVAPIMPDPDTAAFETAIQRHVHHCGLPVPAIRAASGPTDELDRAWTVMDHAPGQPMLSGLTAMGAVRRASALYRRLPDLLAQAAADLHRYPTDGPHLAGHHNRADPHYDLGFTTLMLANPPLGGPAPVRAIARNVGSHLARRFLLTYTRLSGTAVDPERLSWGHAVHARRAFVEIAS